MQKSWGIPSGIAATIAALLSSIVAGSQGSILTLGFSLCAVVFSGATIVFLVSKTASKTKAEQTSTLRAKPSDKHPESIALAADHKKEIDKTAELNQESATRVKVEIDDAHLDEESGLLSNSFFPVYLEQRITAARRTLRPVSLVTFELDGLDKNDSHSPSDRNFYISAVGDVVKRTLRESDCAFRIDENIFAAVMDDTTESGAVWAAERVRGVLHTGALAGRVTVSAGVACYPSHALESNDLIDCSNKALEAAKARGVDQVEIAAEK